MGEIISYGKDRLHIQRLSVDMKKTLFFDEGVSCGSGGMVSKPFEEEVTLWEHFLKYDDEAFIVETFGDSMIDAGIECGDRAIFVKKEDYNNGDIVLAIVNGDALIKYFYKSNNAVWLVPGNEKYRPRMIEPTDDFVINGVLVQILKPVRNKIKNIARLVKDEEKRLPFIKETSEIPLQLQGNRANVQLDFLVENNLLQSDWKPVPGVPQWKLGGLADRLGDYFDIPDKWKFFSDLWNVNKEVLRVKWAEAKNLKKEKEFSKNILNRIY